MHSYFDDSKRTINTLSIIKPLRDAKSDDEIARTVDAMNDEIKQIFGEGHFLEFDRSNMSSNVARRIRIWGWCLADDGR